MSKPDIQYFTEDGTWVKPPGAKRVTVVLKGGNSTLGEPVPGSSGNGGAAFFGYGAGQPAAAPAPPYGGRDGELAACELRAGDLPPLVEVRVGEGGYALILTHLQETGGQR